MRHLIALVLVLATAGAALACPRHSGSRRNVRPCFANQKTVVGAIEMYNLDRNCRVEDHIRRGDGAEAYGYTGMCQSEVHRTREAVGTEVLAIPQALWDALHKGGYLQSIPLDPGQGEKTQNHYLLVSWGNGVFCSHHGEIQPMRQGLTPRAQLKAAGFDPAKAPVAISDADPYAVPWYEQFPIDLTIFLALLAGLFWTLIRAGSNSERTAAGWFLGAVGWGGMWMFLAVPLSVIGFHWLPVVGVASQMGAAGAAVLVGIGRGIGMLVVGAVATRATKRASHTPVPPRALTDSAGLRCAVCATEGGPSGWVTCPACEAAHHKECWTFQDGCAAFGCTMAHGRWRTGQSLPVRQRGAPQKPAGVNWVD